MRERRSKPARVFFMGARYHEPEAYSRRVRLGYLTQRGRFLVLEFRVPMA